MKNISLLFFFLLTGSFGYTQHSLTGFFGDRTEPHLRLEKQFDELLETERIGNHIRHLSARPHHLGSEAGKESAEYIAEEFRKYGWDTEIEVFHVLMPTPRERVLELVGPEKFSASLQEPGVEGDPTSDQEGRLPPYVAFSGDGDVTAELVFVNYGYPDDYEVLEKMGIDVKGKIVIAKYGRGWRGTKPKLALEHGAVGCIIYSDPADDGYMAGDVYPEGAFKNEYGVQRGSVMDIVIHPGDPTTPGEGSLKEADRLTVAEAETILKIPVLPVGYHDAEPLLKAMGGQNVPRQWQGGLPFAYHMGPGPAVVRLKTTFDWDIVPCYNVIAKIEGAEFPDEWVIRGNHHDAWVHGAADPLSGLAAELEEARAIGELMKSGWKPKRTLVYCAWDGEEQGLLGSTEWVETHREELQEKAVLYINSDNNSRGFLHASGSHALESLMTEIARSVTDPQTGVSVLERSNARQAVNAKNPDQKISALRNQHLKLGALGSGSDYSSFIQHLGIPALNLAYGGEGAGGEYHTNYDSYANFVRFKDPGFHYGRTLAQTAGRIVLRMADADILPFRFSHVSRTVTGYKEELVRLIEDKRALRDAEAKLNRAKAYETAADPVKNFRIPELKPPVPYLDFSSLENALVTLSGTTDTLMEYFDRQIRDQNPSPAVNKLLYRGEQQLLGGGLPRRPWYRHVIYAPGFYTGYGVKTMPGIREAIEEENWEEAQEQVRLTAEKLEELAAYFQEYLDHEK